MTLREILTLENWEQFGDMDVYNDVTDEQACAWCGTICTDYGESVYKHILELPAELQKDTWMGGDTKCIVVLVDQFDDWEYKWDEASTLFSDMAGYIADEEYTKRFINDDEPEENNGKETNAGYDILMKLTSSGSGYEEGYVLGFKQKSTGPEWVTWGYHKRPNEEPSYYWGHYFNDAETAKKDLLNRMSGMLVSLETMI